MKKREKEAPLVLTAAEMKAAEAAAVEKGASYAGLMQNAGGAAAREILQIAPNFDLLPRALLLCGRGNNTGDAFVVAGHLARWGWQVQVLLLCGETLSPLAQQTYLQIPGSATRVKADTADYAAPLVVDGVFGTGFHGGLPQEVEAAFNRANAGGGVRVALDVPSGLNCDTGEITRGCFAAHYTLAFGAYKPALLMQSTRAVVGQARCLDIGL